MIARANPSKSKWGLSCFERVFCCVVAALAWSAPAAAQAPLAPLPAPNLKVEQTASGHAIVRQADGRIVVGGSFEFADGQAHAGLVRFLSDGSVDPSWTTAIDGSGFVDRLVADSSGRIYVGGSFSGIGGVVRNALVRMDANGHVDAAWTPTLNGQIYALALDESSGSLYVSGNFTSINNVARNGLAKLSINDVGSVDLNWAPNPDREVSAIVVSGNAVFVSGGFETIGGQVRKHLAKLSASGSGGADSIWSCDLDLYSAALMHDPVSGQLLVGGNYTTIDGVPRTGLTRVGEGGTGVVDQGWNPNLTGGDARALSYAAPDTLYLVGPFKAVGGLPIRNAARISLSSGMVDPNWTPDPDYYTNAILPQPDGTAYLLGEFTYVRGSVQESIARVSAAGELDSSFAGRITSRGFVRTVVAPNPGEVYFGGQFTRIDGIVRTNAAKLSNGVLDASWLPNPNGAVYTLSPMSANTRMLVGGYFTFIGGKARQSLAKVNLGDGAADASFVSNTDGYILTAAASASGVFVGGQFNAIGGQARTNLALLDANSGAANPAWTQSADGTVYRVWPTSTNQVYVAGFFATVGNVTRNGIARVSALGAGDLDLAWNPAAPGGTTVWTVSTSPDQSSVYVSGSFSQMGGLARPGLARLNTSNGNADPVWAPNVFGTVTSVQVDSQGGVVIGGSFFSVGGAPHDRLARVSATGTGAVDPLWNPKADQSIYAMALESGGGVLAVGPFSTVSAVSRLGIAKFPGAGVTIAITGNGPNPSVYGQAYSVEAAVNSTFATPVGSVAFDDGQGHTCNAALSAGVATCSFANTGAGAATITARYVPSSDAFAAAAATAAHDVQKADAVLSIADAPDPSEPGQSFTVTASIAAALPSHAVPGGSVFVTVDGGEGCSIALSQSTSCALSIAATGNHNLTASYPGDANFNASSASAISHAVNAASTSTTLNVSSANAVVGQTLTFGFSVSGGSTVPGGTVSVVRTDTGAIMCSASVATGQCSAAFDTTGNYTVRAGYPGDASHSGSTSSSRDLVVGAAGTSLVIGISGGASSAIAGDAVTFSVDVHAVAPGAGSPSGTVTITDGSNSCTRSLSALSTCSIAFPTAAQGVRSLTGTFTPSNGNYLASTSNTLSFTVNLSADLSISVSDDRDVLQGGEHLDYVIVAANAGPHAVVGAVVQDTAPIALAGVAWVCNGSGAACPRASGSGSIDESVDLPAGASLTYTLSGSVPANVSGAIIDTATIALPAFVVDPDGSDRSATDTDQSGLVFKDGFEGGSGAVFGVQDQAKRALIDLGAADDLGLDARPRNLLRVPSEGEAMLLVQLRSIDGRSQVRLVLRGTDGVWRRSAWGAVDSQSVLELAWDERANGGASRVDRALLSEAGGLDLSVSAR